MSKDNKPSQTWGILAEFDSDTAILEAAAKVRDAGYTNWDSYTPFPVHGLDASMGMKATKLPWLVLFCAFCGAAGGYFMQYWMNAVDYAYVIAGKPFHSAPSQIPVTFEVTILFSAFAAFFGSMILNGLPRFYHPLFRSERFRKVTTDKFFICIESADPSFSEAKTRSFLESLSPSHVESVKE